MPTHLQRILIANRGEIAIRVHQTAQDQRLETVAVYPDEDRQALHVQWADQAVALPGNGVRAYLDGEALCRIARETGCDAIHPGYGFLSEQADFARLCAESGLIFIGPSVDALTELGDKAKARALAHELNIPLLPGTRSATTLADAQQFVAALKPGETAMLKALSGGGGRGIRKVEDPAALPELYRACQDEALAAFGNGDLYIEQRLDRARHIEVQIAGDGKQAVAMGDRDCSLQRRQQKLVEIAPAPELPDTARKGMAEAAVRLVEAVGYQGIGTVEFLVDAENPDTYWFMEVNPRIQVEHTVTEAVTDIDLVETQLRLAAGESLLDLGFDQTATPTGFAIQLRINAERLTHDGEVRSSAGRLRECAWPAGPGVRVDSAVRTGMEVHPAFDSLLGKIITSGADLSKTIRRARRALEETRITGVTTNREFLQALLDHPQLERSLRGTTGFIADHMRDLMALMPRAPEPAEPVIQSPSPADTPTPEGCEAVPAPTQGTLVRMLVDKGQAVPAGGQIAVIEAMKMEFLVAATVDGTIEDLLLNPGDSVHEEQSIAFIRPGEVGGTAQVAEDTVDPDHIRPDLEEVLERHGKTLDEARVEAVEKRRSKGKRTARENVAHLLDDEQYIEYGALALAAQRRRRKPEKLMDLSPADGLIAKIGTVNADRFGPETSRCMALAYDYTVFAGTQGVMNHKKTDRMLQLAEEWHIPLVFFTEGGGGRPGDTDYLGVSGLDCHTFAAMAALSGKVPLVGIASGRCFAGNAALLGCTDVIIATRDTTVGMAGPAMIEGGGLGRFKPEEVGPVSVQAPNGVIDLVANDEAEATELARQYLSYFQGRLEHWEAPDQRLLRHVIPENRLQVYDIRRVIDTLADNDSVLELRRDFAPGMITALVRIEGQPMGLIANNPAHLGGAIDSDGADKAARFMQLCNAFDLPLLSLCDTPGFMVGPDAEQTATVRHVSRLFVGAAHLQIPVLTLVLRKGYGLGAQAMAAGSFHSPLFTAAWPSGEFGAMGLEGAVRLGFAKELAAVEDPTEREALFKRMVDKAYEQGKAINTASFLEIDAVIDPAQSRRWILTGLNATAGRERSSQSRFIDTW